MYIYAYGIILNTEADHRDLRTATKFVPLKFIVYYQCVTTWKIIDSKKKSVGQI